MRLSRAVLVALSAYTLVWGHTQGSMMFSVGAMVGIVVGLTDWERED